MRGCSVVANRTGGHGDKSGAAKPVLGLRQRAQEMKKRHFEEMIRNFAVTNEFFMALLRHPRLTSEDGLMELVEEWRKAKTTKEYQDAMRVAATERNPVMEAWMRLKQ